MWALRISWIKRNRCVAITKIWKDHAILHLLARFSCFREIKCEYYLKSSGCSDSIFYTWIFVPNQLTVVYRGHLEISASALALTSALALQKVYFALRTFSLSKTSMRKSFPSIFAGFPRSFSCCLEQLFSRKLVSTCFWRKELNSGRYLTSFKSRHGWKLQFADQ